MSRITVILKEEKVSLLVVYFDSLDCGLTFWRCIVLYVVTNVSDELTASIFGVNMEAVCSFLTLV
jgi:hypothetical protein